MIIPRYFFYFPLGMFILVTFLMGIINNPDLWKWAFLVGGLEALFVTGLGVYNKQAFDRFALGINLFLMLGAIGLSLIILL